MPNTSAGNLQPNLDMYLPSPYPNPAITPYFYWRCGADVDEETPGHGSEHTLSGASRSATAVPSARNSGLDRISNSTPGTLQLRRSTCGMGGPRAEQCAFGARYNPPGRRTSAHLLYGAHVCHDVPARGGLMPCSRTPSCVLCQKMADTTPPGPMLSITSPESTTRAQTNPVCTARRVWGR